MAASEILIVNSPGSVSKLDGVSNKITPYRGNGISVNAVEVSIPKLVGLEGELDQGLELSHDVGTEVSETTLRLFNSSIDELLTHFDNTNDLSTGNESIQINECRHTQTNDDSLDISRPNTPMQIDEPGSWQTNDQSPHTSNKHILTNETPPELLIEVDSGNDQEDSFPETQPLKKRKKRHQVDTKEWAVNKNKAKRELGKNVCGWEMEVRHS